MTIVSFELAEALEVAVLAEPADLTRRLALVKARIIGLQPRGW